jgi:hypothetical protein
VGKVELIFQFLTQISDHRSPQRTVSTYKVSFGGSNFNVSSQERNRHVGLQDKVGVAANHNEFISLLTIEHDTCFKQVSLQWIGIANSTNVGACPMKKRDTKYYKLSVSADVITEKFLFHIITYSSHTSAPGI